jgi:hypothetical protein
MPLSTPTSLSSRSTDHQASWTQSWPSHTATIVRSLRLSAPKPSSRLHRSDQCCGTMVVPSWWSAMGPKLGSLSCAGRLEIQCLLARFRMQQRNRIAMADCLLFTIGHSNHSAAHFQSLLKEFGIQVLVDVRSWPHSRFVEWADQSLMPDVVHGADSKYLFLGDSLGGRPEGSEFYDRNGHVLYWRVARTGNFLRGIDRLQKGVEVCRVAVMCSEENPETCHRRLLVSKVMMDRGVEVRHIRGDRQCEAEKSICFSEDSLFNDEEALWISSRSVSRNRAPSTSFSA